MATANDVNRLYLQAILSRGRVSEPLAKLLWKKCIGALSAVDNTLDLPDSDSAEAWDIFVAKINKSFDDFDLDFRRCVDESTGKPVYIVANAKSDEIAQLATDYTPAETSYFRALVEQIMLAPRQSFSISSMAALREIRAIKPKSNMTKTQAENVLTSFVARGWLLKSSLGRYSLSSRSIVELCSYLKATYPEEVIECSICNEVMTRGVACCGSNCANHLHYHCFDNLRKRHGACPQCGKDWPMNANDKTLIPIGEGAARDGDDARRRVRVQSVEPSDEEMSEEGGPSRSPAMTQSQRPPQRSQRTSATQRRDTRMDIDEDYAAESQKRPTRSQARRVSRR